MSNELHAHDSTGKTLYAVLLNSVGQAAAGVVFEVISGANWATYDIALTEAAAGIYLATMPAVAAGAYSYAVYEQAGANPATTDTLRGLGYIDWDGSAEVPNSALGAAIAAIPSAADVADAVADEVLSGHIGAGSLAVVITDILADTGTTLPATLATLGPGVGAHSLVYTVTDSVTGLPVADVLVEVSTDTAKANVIRSGRTDSFGVVTFYLSAAGRYYVWRTKDGFAATDPDTEDVL